MVCTSVSSVADKLHSANHLSNSEEPENFAHNDGAGGELCAVEVADGGDLRLGEKGGWVCSVLDELLEVGLESGERSMRNSLASDSRPRASCMAVE
jgi:hypothetical protein